MNTARLVQPRALRPCLSTRYQLLRRAESTAQHTNPPTPPTSSSPPPNPSFLTRHFSKFVWACLGGAIGVLGGSFVVHTLAPPTMPAAGTREDSILVADLNKRIDQEFKVKVLRGKCLGVAKQLKGEEGGWVELIGPAAAPPLPTEEKDKGVLAQLQGAKGLGVERLFWQRGDERLVAVVWFGGSLSGWPGVTHGGAIATALVEKMALAAFLADARRSDVLAAATPQRLPGTGDHAKMFRPASKPEEPTGLELSYAKPSHANQFYIIRVQPAMPTEDESGYVTRGTGKGGGGRREYEAVLETLDARVCVKAKASFPPTSAVGTAVDATPEGSKMSFAEFKAWLWPSRQETSQIG